MPSKPFKKQGFSIIELIIVIAIMGILATLLLVSLNASREKARIAQAQSEIGQIYLAISLLENDSGQWPGHKRAFKKQCNPPDNQDNEICVYLSGNPSDNCAYGLSDCKAGLVCNDPANLYPGWQTPYYLPYIPKDPWGHEYFFDTDYYIGGACRVVIGSAGPNGLANIKNDIPGDADDVIYIISAE